MTGPRGHSVLRAGTPDLPEQFSVGLMGHPARMTGVLPDSRQHQICTCGRALWAWQGTGQEFCPLGLHIGGQSVIQEPIPGPQTWAACLTGRLSHLPVLPPVWNGVRMQRTDGQNLQSRWSCEGTMPRICRQVVGSTWLGRAGAGVF